MLVDEKLTILYADDDQDDQYLFRCAMEEIDPSVIIHEAGNGQKALELLQQASEAGNLPSLVILDMNMPVMNGGETFERIKQDELLSSIPLVVFSTSFTNKDFDHWAKENIPAFKKPATFQEFTHCVEQILSVAFCNK